LLLFISSLVALGICFVFASFCVWVAKHCPSLPSPHPPKPIPLPPPAPCHAALQRPHRQWVGGNLPPLNLPYGTPTTALGSAVGTPLGRAHRVVLPSPTPPTYGPPLARWALCPEGAPTELGGGRRRGKGGFEGLQGGLRAWAAERF
jgi:hypothetical protein